MSIYNSKDPNVQRFIEHVESLCEEHNVKLDIRNTNFVWADGVRAGGFFDGEAQEIRVAGNHKQALHIFTHEFGHMTQWLDKRSVWYRAKYDHFKLDGWLLGNRVCHINKIIDEIAMIEYDNEKRTIELIKKFKLPIDVKDYIRGANAYIFFYLHMKNTRRWSSPANSPYMNKKVISACPAKFFPKFSDYPKYFEEIQSVYEEQNI